MTNFLIVLSLFLYFTTAYAASKSKPHSHNGVLTPYDGKQISYTLTKDQQKKMDAGLPIIINEAKGKGGRGFVLQDIEATGSICLDRIADLKMYPKMVPHVKAVEIYDEESFSNGTTRNGAQFTVGLFGMRFGYFLKLTREPKYNTLTWTLDHKYNSDFDDTVGHWQVMPHPTKAGWSRVLYSTQLKLPSWVPGIIVNFLTNSALVEATSWVKKESEKEFKKSGGKTTSTSGGGVDGSAPAACYSEDEAGAHYDSVCYLEFASATVSDKTTVPTPLSASTDNGDGSAGRESAPEPEGEPDVEAAAAVPEATSEVEHVEVAVEEERKEEL